jgi:hypothetical protein
VPEQARAETPFGPAILVTQDPNRTSSAISRSCFIAGSGTTINPKFGSLPHWAIAASISLEPRIGAVTTSTRKPRSRSHRRSEPTGRVSIWVGQMATRATCGAISLSSSSIFAPKLGSEPIAVPMLWPDPDQYDPGCLHEQRAQIAIADICRGWYLHLLFFGPDPRPIQIDQPVRKSIGLLPADVFRSLGIFIPVRRSCSGR